ncbi:MAG TPA: HEPN domain-containing protein [Intrasporangium sp.]|nr:HEPN domain-containing protein [Intrasporangium sp.]
MSRWTPGQAEIELLLSKGDFQRVTGAQANGEHLLDRAERTLATASNVAGEDADSAFVLAYDAARYSGAALLAQQGLRATTSGGHYAVEVALRAQFGTGFRPFGALRRRRHELEYPTGPGETASPEEAHDALDDAGRLLDAARRLLPSLDLF